MSKTLYNGGNSPLLVNSVVKGTFVQDAVTLANGTSTIPFDVYGTVKVTPNAWATYTANTAGVAMGARATLLILTSGSTNYGGYWGSGFNTSNTYFQTGTGSGLTLTFNFIFDGTKWQELSRTAAI
jgi:hypothetical protein